MVAIAAAMSASAVQAAPLSALLGQDPKAFASAVGRADLDPASLVWRSNGRRIEVFSGRRLCVDGRFTALDLLFEDGRLVMAAPHLNQRRRFKADAVEFWKVPTEPVSAPFAGALPFSDQGAAFFARFGVEALSATSQLEPCLANSYSLAGKIPPGARIVRGRRRQVDVAGVVQGIGLLPLAWMLPIINAKLRRAAERGEETLALLRLGASIPGGVAALERRKGVRLYRRGGDYAVASIDMGAAPSNNLSPTHRAAFVGLVGSRVIWMSRDGAWVWGDMCLGLDGVPGAVRKGCSSTGYFEP